MSYYPILNAPDCIGWTTLCNFSPNNWEVRRVTEKYLNVTWCQEGMWWSKNLEILAPEKTRTIGIADIANLVPSGSLPLLSLTNSMLPERCDVLPRTDTERTNFPAWRATLGLSTAHTSTSYQGEIDPFPAPGSLLTFSPFIQFGDGVENFLIFLNLETSAVARSARLEIYDSAQPDYLKGVFDVCNNSATVISLDRLEITPTDLPVIISKGMSAIPLYFSRTRDGEYLSLEHTHPPASYVVHGKRWEAQKLLKNLWFSKVAR
jgi:hypothetical protein